MKEIVTEEYLPDITNGMMNCLIRAGSVRVRSKIWKFFVIARDGYKQEVLTTSSKRNKSNKKDDFAFHNEPLPSVQKKQTSDVSVYYKREKNQS